MGKTDRGLSPERWEYLKKLKPSPGRYIHISKPLVAVPIIVDIDGEPKVIGERMVVTSFKGTTHRSERIYKKLMRGKRSRRQWIKDRKALRRGATL